MPGESVWNDRSDDELHRAIVSGDVGAYTALFERHALRLIRFARTFLGSHEEAEHVVQDVLWNVWQQRNGWHVPGTVVTYLLAAVRNRCYNQLEHRRIVQRYEHIASDSAETVVDAADVDVETTELRVTVQRAIDSLPPAQREAVVLRYQQQLSYKECAAVMRTSTKAFEMHLARAIDRLGKHPEIEWFRPEIT